MFPGMQLPLHGDGDVPNLVTDLRDVGKFVARIVDDERTLNRSVYGWGELLTEKQIYDAMEEVSEEKLDRVYASPPCHLRFFFVLEANVLISIKDLK